MADNISNRAQVALELGGIIDQMMAAHAAQVRSAIPDDMFVLGMGRANLEETVKILRAAQAELLGKP